MIDSIRQAIHDAIESNPADLPAKGIAQRMGVNRSTVYDWGENERTPISMERFVQFSLVTCDNRPIGALCRELGGVFVPLPTRAGRGVDASAMRTLKEFADVMQESSKALSDGVLTETEMAKIRREGAQAQRALAHYLADLERQAAEAR